MTTDIERIDVRELDWKDGSLTTPAGFEAIATLTSRRLTVAVLNLGTWALLNLWAGIILTAGGWSVLDTVLLACVAAGTPWSVLGFWNAAIGLWQLHGRGPVRRTTAPFVITHHDQGCRTPLTIRVAILMTLRNEDTARALLRLKTVKASLDSAGEGAHFSYFVLSDTDVPDIAAREEEAVAAWQAEDPDRARILYRRRTDNRGFKAGNVRDFAMHIGNDFELMLPLDADSLMTGPAILDLVRIMERHPKLGILQSLVVGTPASSAFARIFQFGMRLGMRTYTMGQAWWTADCGPFWGHNALIRIKPFVEHCALPSLPGKPPLGGEILSHDQVEAVLMRRAGYEVRVMPVETGSYEDNPPDALEFMRRDQRWCQGNMQYLRLIGLPGLRLVSRIQLIWAILMFAGIPAWTLMIALLPFAALEAQATSGFPATSLEAFYVVVLLMYLAPKLAGLIDAALTPGEVARFGGRLRFTASAILEILFSFLLGALTSLRTTIFLAGLPFGKSITWASQRRDGDGVTWRVAASALWPHQVFGLAVCGALLEISPHTLLWSLPLTAGFLVAIPFTVLTASPALGRWLREMGLAGVPEDFATPPEISAVQTAMRG